MSLRFLVIHESDDLPDGVRASTAEGVCWDRVTWSALRPDALDRFAADLIVPIAVPYAAPAARFFDWLQTHPILTPILAVLPAETPVIEAATGSLDDFVLWPVRAGEWHERVQRLVGGRGTQETPVHERLAGEIGLSRLIGRAPSFRRTLARIPLAARSGSPVLITGETGTGKELCARAIHHLGARRSQPFIPVDCGAVPEHLFENEVFGHVRGAFTDAQSDQKGLLAMADGGTLFLDEIDALSLSAQAKLLRFLQERTFKPLGADRFARADVIVLSATNRDLEGLVREKRFRSDLYFRLNVLGLHLAPLRERREDIPLLARHFADAVCAEQGTPRRALSRGVLARLASYDWPGNVRELHNVLQRAFVFSQGRSILASDLLMAGGCEGRGDEPASFREARAVAVETFERRYVADLLQQHGGNVTRAARDAGKERRAFGRLVKKYGLARSSA
jgi:DNA-binding NtrC family response regulator